MYFNTIAFNSVSGKPYFLGQYSSLSGPDNHQPNTFIDYDSAGNIYAGLNADEGRCLLKLDELGNVLWVTNVEDSDDLKGAVVNDNYILVSSFQSSGEYHHNFYFDSSGNQFQTRDRYQATLTRSGKGFVDGASGTSVSSWTTNGYYPEIVITDSSGVLACYRGTNEFIGQVEGVSVNFSIGQALGLYGYSSTGSRVTRWSLSTGIEIGTRNVTNINNSGEDGFSTIYVVGFDSSWAFVSNANSYGPLVGEIRNNSTFRNVKSIVGVAASNTNRMAIATDSNGHIYSLFNNYGEMVLLKHDSTDFGLVWAREIDAPSGGDLRTISLNANEDTIYVAFYQSTAEKNYIMAYPADGSTTGNFDIGTETIRIAPSAITLLNSSISTEFESMTSTSHSVSESTFAWEPDEIEFSQTVVRI